MFSHKHNNSHLDWIVEVFHNYKGICLKNLHNLKALINVPVMANSAQALFLLKLRDEW